MPRETVPILPACCNRSEEDTISELADRYLREHVDAHNKPSTAKEIRRLVEQVVKPGLGRFKITELTRPDIKAWHQGMNGTATMANRALAACSKMLALACEDWGLRTDNPCLGLSASPSTSASGSITDDELTRVGKVLAAMERTSRRHPASFCW